jgi:hypothetical protein
MIIDKAILSEKNYTGTRLIEITDEKVISLLEEVKKCGVEAEPFLNEMEKLTPALEVIYAELKPIEEKRAELKARLTEELKPFQVQQEQADLINQKADAIKEKLYPIARNVIKDQLSEFEMGGQFIERDGKTFIEVTDQLEEKIKQIRQFNLKK